MKPEFEDLPSSTAATPSPTNRDLQDLPPSVDTPAMPGEAHHVTQSIDNSRDEIGAPTPSAPPRLKGHGDVVRRAVSRMSAYRYLRMKESQPICIPCSAY